MNDMPVKHRLLVIDDEADILETIKQYAEKMDFLIETTQSGKEGLEKLLTNQFDAAIVDLRLGDNDIDGTEIIHQAGERSLHAAIIVLTGHGEREDAIKALNDGAVAWFDKPVKYTELLKETKKLSYLIPPEKFDELISLMSSRA
jgi:DNA-binding response OmpR family regulator